MINSFVVLLKCVIINWPLKILTSILKVFAVASMVLGEQAVVVAAMVFALASEELAFHVPSLPRNAPNP
jgi:hypothetical protein